MDHILKLLIKYCQCASSLLLRIVSISYCLLTQHKLTVFLIFPKNIHILLFGHLEWNRYVLTPYKSLPMAGAFTSHVTVAVDAGEEITMFARVDTAIQSAATLIAILPRMFQPHRVHMQHAQLVDHCFLMTPEVATFRRIQYACFKTCEQKGKKYLES